MKQGPRYHVKPRRRREGKTDYRKRLKLLKSRKIRIVVRKSLKNTQIQFVEYKEIGDNILVSANSKELTSKYNWKYSTSSTPAAYLTGLIAGKRAKDKGIDECVLDIGRYIPVTGSKIFASLKGVLDAGIICSHDEKKLPNDDRITGKQIDEKLVSIVNNIKNQIIGR
ncbi:MAG: 50S ribosomal protein L18 [Thermoplasmatales archaeon]|jgi:large subunit ribosomal protein L18|nr:MAG: 50S ribosomal protein L18 [Thermoplasmatales archaeon]